MSDTFLVSLWNNLMSGGTDINYPIEKRRRIILLNGVLFAGMVLLAVYGIGAFLEGFSTVALVGLSVVVILLLLTVYLRASRNYNLSAHVSVLVMGGLLAYLAYAGGAGGAGYIWSFVYPLFTIFLLGRKRGVLVIGCYFAVIMLVFFTELVPGAVSYPFAVKYRFIGVFTGISFLSAFFEYISILFERRIKEENGRLQQANEELRSAISRVKQSEETVRSLVERSTDSIIVIQDETVKMVNGPLARLGGYVPEEIIGTPFIDYVYPDERKDLRANYLMRLKGVSLPATYRSALLHKNGTRLDVEISGGAVQIDGKPADLVFIREVGPAEFF